MLNHVVQQSPRYYLVPRFVQLVVTLSLLSVAIPYFEMSYYEDFTLLVRIFPLHSLFRLLSQRTRHL